MAVESGNFFIREYVAAIREKDPERCSPFTVVSDQNVPHGIEDSERYEAERKRKGKAVVEPGIQTGYEAERKRKGKAVVEIGIQTASKLEGLKQHESGPKDASAYEPEIVKGNNAGLQTDTHANTNKQLLESKLEGLKQHESGPKDASESKLEGLKQHESGPKDTSAYEPEIFKGSNAGLQTDTHANTNNQLSEIVTIGDSDDDTSRTISDLQMEVVKSQCSNGRTVEGAGNENSVPADDDAAGSKRKLKKIKKPKLRLLADIHSELDSRKVKTDIPRALKVSSDRRVGPKARPTIDVKNDSDDVTLLSLRKRKESQINHNKKLQKALKAKEPQLDDAKCKGSGACDGLGGRKPSGSGSVVGRHVGASGDLKGLGPEVNLATVVDREVLVCSLNQNPADYLFMQGKNIS